MTTPGLDPLLQLPQAIVDQQESPAIMRIGVVAAIVEGSQITVKVSGSEVLIDCSYLLFQYFPLLGDRVILIKQDSQWVCLGQMTGPVGSNNLLYNPSFELGAVGSIPDGWTVNVISSGAGVPSFLVASYGSPLTGKQIVDFGTDSIGAGVSQAEAWSRTVDAQPGSAWTAAFWQMGVLTASVAPDFSDLDFFIEFTDSTGAVIASNGIVGYSTSADVYVPLYKRLSLALYPTGKVIAPTGTQGVRVRFLGRFGLPAASFFSFFIDNVILRQVD